MLGGGEEYLDDGWGAITCLIGIRMAIMGMLPEWCYNSGPPPQPGYGLR